MTEDLHIQWCGDDVLMVDGGNKATLRQIAGAIRSAQIFEEVVDGNAGFAVQFDPLAFDIMTAQTTLRNFLDQHQQSGAVEPETVTLEVRFGGEFGQDLAESAEALGLSEAELVKRVCAADLHVDMLGFTPGFAYITGLPADLSVPRRQTPRQSVPAGSLGLAAGMLGTYALDGPGGWQIIGRIETSLFDPQRDDPFLLNAGMRVRLEVMT